MSNNQGKVKQQRASSARPSSHERIRPASGNSNKNHQKIDFIANMYGGFTNYKKVGSRHFTGKVGLTFHQQNDISKTFKAKIYKNKEQLLEENNHLKKEINKLQQELSIQRSKIQIMRKRTSQYTKKYNAQFQKELYWTGTQANMVRGVKNQYEQMKERFEQKCHEMNELAKQVIFSQAREDKAYIDVLQSENRKFVDRIDEERLEMKYMSITSSNEEQIEMNKRFKFELIQENKNLRQKIGTFKSRVNNLIDQIEHKDKKILFLDKLLIEKSNNQYHAKRKLKKAEKQKIDMVEQFVKYKQQKQGLIEIYQNKLKRLKQTADRQSETEHLIFKKQLEERDVRTGKLEKEIAYLTTLLSYWKPLDEINNIISSKMIEGKIYQDKEMILEYSMNSTLKFNASRQHQREEENELKKIPERSRKGSNEQNKNSSEIISKSIQLTFSQKKVIDKKKRGQLTADKRNTQEGIKSRKVDLNDIADICQTLKYRFIGSGVTMQEVRKYFDFQGQDQTAFLLSSKLEEPSEEQTWDINYVSMREVKSILQNKIFGLNETDSILLSRYLIEDSHNDYVYCDPNNENMRTVVKSIIKNIVSEYLLPTDLPKLQAAARDIIYKYETNLQSALKATASKGFIPKKKLLQLFKGLGIDLTSEMQDYFVGKVILGSQNLTNLKYSILFDR